MTKKKYGVRTVNGNEPDPETGNVDVSVSGSQDLQSVVENGNTITDHNVKIYSAESADVATLQNNQVWILGAGETSSVGIAITDWDFGSGIAPVGSLNLTSPAVDGIRNATLMANPNSTGNNNYFIMPIGSEDGTAKTLATLDDISGGSGDLQSVLDNGGLASFNSGNQFIKIFDDAEEAEGMMFQVSTTGVDGSLSSMSINPEGFYADSHGVDNIYNSSISMAGGSFDMFAEYAGNQTSLHFNEPIANTSISFPAKAEGTYTLATTDDIPPPAASINAGTANRLTKYNSSGINLVDSNITDNGTTVVINKPTEITSGMADVSGLKFTNLQNSTTPSVTILGTTGTTPLDITIDAAGNVYTCNQTTSNVTKITPAGISSVFAAAGNEPQGMTIDPAGNLYVANRNNGTVTKITPAGTSSIFATTGVYPRGITIDGLGNIYTSNYGSANVTKITPTGVSSVYGTTGTNPVNITIDAIGNIYTCNYNSDNVTKITPDGTSSILGTTGSRPTGIAVDAAGNVYTANYYSNTVTKITPAGVSTIFGTTDIRPTDIVLDTSGNAYVINNGSSSVTKITAAGVSSILAATGTNPQSMVKDTAGTIYICNSGSANVTKIAFPASKLLTLDASGNVIKNTEDISQSWIKDNKIITNIAVFADNAAAITGGLSVGTQYRTATGIVMIVY